MATSTQCPPLHNGHLYTMATSTQCPPLHNVHLYTMTTFTQWPPLHNDHLYTMATSTQQPPLHNGHLYTILVYTGHFSAIFSHGLSNNFNGNFILHDQQLLTKLSCGGDLVALEAKYHATCLAKLYRKAQTSSYDDNGEEKIVRPEGIALAELVAYIEESTLTIFKLADLAKAYKSRLEQLGVNMTARVNTTRLKERLLIHLPGLEDHNNGRDVYLAFKDDLGRMMEKAHQEDCDEEAIHLAKAAQYCA
ncbi:hypothetical protein QZH41_001760 [Actinostola sp. cb2023]|nr:hypothetical protein QZH41_001760 [Actinostola sp. cb2023]